MAHSRKRKRDLRLAELYDMLPQDLKTYLIDPDVYLYLHKRKFIFVLQQLEREGVVRRWAADLSHPFLIDFVPSE